MEFLLLAKIGMLVNVVTTSGYVVAGGYLVRTGIQYITDYKQSIEREKSEVDV